MPSHINAQRSRRWDSPRSTNTFDVRLSPSADIEKSSLSDCYVKKHILLSYCLLRWLISRHLRTIDQFKGWPGVACASNGLASLLYLHLNPQGYGTKTNTFRPGLRFKACMSTQLLRRVRNVSSSAWQLKISGGRESVRSSR